MAKNMRLKQERIEANKDTCPYATAKYLRISPYKIRTVLALIRGKSVDEAAGILTYCNKGGSDEVKKVLLSAAANAEHNQGMDRSDLYVSEAFANGGPHLKRMQPVSKGRGHAILKRTSHVTVILDAKKV